MRARKALTIVVAVEVVGVLVVVVVVVGGGGGRGGGRGGREARQQARILQVQRSRSAMRRFCSRISHYVPSKMKNQGHSTAIEDHIHAAG